MTAAGEKKKKAFEFARELGIETRDVIALAAEIGEKITNPSSNVSPEQQELLRAQQRKKTGEKSRQPSSGKLSGKEIMARLKAAHAHASAKPKAPKAPDAESDAPALPDAGPAPEPALSPPAETAAAPAPPPPVAPLPPPSLRLVKAVKAARPAPIIEEVAAPSPSAPPPKPAQVEPMALPKLRIKKDRSEERRVGKECRL